MDVTPLSGAVAIGRRRGPALESGRQRGEEPVEPFYNGGIAPNHEAVTALEAPDATGRAGVDVVDAALAERLGSADVVVIVGVAPVDHGIVGREQRHEVAECRLDDSGRHHDPNRARLVQLANQLGKRAGCRRARFDQILRRLWVDVEHHAFVAGPKKPTNHVGPHPSEPDHSDFHLVLFRFRRLRRTRPRADVERRASGVGHATPTPDVRRR